MRLAILTSKTKQGFTTRIGTLPEPTHFPVTVKWSPKGELMSFGLSPSEDLIPSDQFLGDAGAVLTNFSACSLLSNTSIKDFCKAVEAKHGRQVVRMPDGKLRTVNKVKEDAEVTVFHAEVDGETIDSVTAANENSARATVKGKLVKHIEDGNDDNVAKITAWIKAGSKLREEKSSLADVIDINELSFE